MSIPDLQAVIWITHIKDPEAELYRITACRVKDPAAVAVGLIVIWELRRVDHSRQITEVPLTGPHGDWNGKRKIRTELQSILKEKPLMN